MNLVGLRWSVRWTASAPSVATRTTMRGLLLLLAAAPAAGAVDGSYASKMPHSKVVDVIEPPTIKLGDALVSPPPPVTDTFVVDGREVHMRALHDELQLTYIHGLVSADEIQALVRMADARSGFIKSPLKTQGARRLLAATPHFSACRRREFLSPPGTGRAVGRRR
jgi:hypothetical protein